MLKYLDFSDISDSLRVILGGDTRKNIFAESGAGHEDMSVFVISDGFINDVIHSVVKSKVRNILEAKYN